MHHVEQVRLYPAMFMGGRFAVAESRGFTGWRMEVAAGMCFWLSAVPIVIISSSIFVSIRFVHHSKASIMTVLDSALMHVF